MWLQFFGVELGLAERRPGLGYPLWRSRDDLIITFVNHLTQLWPCENEKVERSVKITKQASLRMGRCFFFRNKPGE